MKLINKTFTIICAALAAAACSAGEWMDGYDSAARDGGYAYSSDGGAPTGVGGGGGEGSEGQGGNSIAGKVTAAEWNDLDHWDFWGHLMNGQDFGDKPAYWKFYTNNRIAVKVVDGQGAPAAGVEVTLERSGLKIWSTISDNAGAADCWLGLYEKESPEDTTSLKLKVNGVLLDQPVKITGWNCPDGPAYNTATIADATAPQSKADIAFIVDATGSMGDEIDFLKADLLSILNKTEASNATVTFRTAALFYRDEDESPKYPEEYLTRYQDFSEDFSKTTGFISKQNAAGGGDYPEAVHIALEKSLQSLSWNESARTKLAFMLLDAPAHHTDKIIESLQKSIQLYAAKGIKIIPIAASGVDKNTEFMLRFFATATGGTYVFITNDSGIGGDHIEATVGDHQIEPLNDLIVRLINKYTE